MDLNKKTLVKNDKRFKSKTPKVSGQIKQTNKTMLQTQIVKLGSIIYTFFYALT